MNQNEINEIARLMMHCAADALDSFAPDDATADEIKTAAIMIAARLHPTDADTIAAAIDAL